MCWLICARIQSVLSLTLRKWQFSFVNSIADWLNRDRYKPKSSYKLIIQEDFGFRYLCLKLFTLPMRIIKLPTYCPVLGFVGAASRELGSGGSGTTAGETGVGATSVERGLTIGSGSRAGLIGSGAGLIGVTIGR